MSLEPRGYLHMHAYEWQVERTRIVAVVPKYGEHAWDYVIISWRHNLGGTFLYFMFAIYKGNFQCFMNVEDCVISKICNAIQLRLTR